MLWPVLATLNVALGTFHYDDLCLRVVICAENFTEFENFCKNG
jgi:hypothetical protein